jgi:hypothetical protein
VTSQLSKLEHAVLDAIADQDPELRPALSSLRVTARRFTGAGSYTDLAHDQRVIAADGFRTLNRVVSVPGVVSGLGASVAVQDGKLDCLELFTYGAETWAGDTSDFCIENGA